MLGFIGGTGPAGRGLALRLALAGEQVLIGSRDLARAKEAAESISPFVPQGALIGTLNIKVAHEADIVFVVVPYAAQRDTLVSLKQELAGKIVVNAVVPFVFNKAQSRAVLVEEGSAALQAQAILSESTVVSAFHSISAQELLKPDQPIDSDVIICADDERAKEIVAELAEKIQGVRAVNGGRLENAKYVEDLTAVLANINRIYKAHSMIRITGIWAMR